MSRGGLLLLAFGALTGPVTAGVITQEGMLSGEGAPGFQDLVLDQFDTQGGALELLSVELDLLTSVIGGGTSNGTGSPTQVFAQLDADYYLETTLLAATQAKIDFTVTNQGPPSAFSLFNTDTELVTIDDAPGLAPWIGSGDITLEVFTQFILDEDPAGTVGFGAGGTIRYAVTYDFQSVPAPAVLAILPVAGLWRRRRR